MPEELNAHVPKTTPINWGVRDLRNYVGREERRLMDEELYPHQKDEMGVVPDHLIRAGKAAASVGAMNALGGAAGTLYNAATSGGMEAAPAGVAESVSEAASLAGKAGKDVLLGPFTLPGAARESFEMHRNAVEKDLNADTAQEVAEARAQMSRAGYNLGSKALGAVLPGRSIVKQYRNPGRQTAETAAKRLAKAKRKQDRKEKDLPLIESYLKRPINDRISASRAVDEGEGERSFQISFAPGG